KGFQSTTNLLAALAGEAVETKKSPRSGGRLWVVSIPAGAFVLVATFLLLRPHSDDVRFRIERFTLANGLPVVFSVDHSAPIFTFSAAYKAGYRRDPAGRSGLAPAGAHRRQQGSATAAAGAVDTLSSERGRDHDNRLPPA